jgi:hypothetical protein
MLQEFILLDHGFEFAARDEEIFAPVLLTASGQTRGVGNGKIEAFHQLADFFDQS